jgi:hypothetical protein
MVEHRRQPDMLLTAKGLAGPVGGRDAATDLRVA